MGLYLSCYLAKVQEPLESCHGVQRSLHTQQGVMDWRNRPQKSEVSKV